jgi:predicted Fe-Mo cluster-binding NifX family protein
MKIAVTSAGATLESTVDQRFGRSTYFILYDTDIKTINVIDNTVNLNAAQGAGIQTAKNVVDAGAKVVITGNVGPKAFSVLSAASIEVVTGANGTVAKAIREFEDGLLNSVKKPTVEGHWV